MTQNSEQPHPSSQPTQNATSTPYPLLPHPLPPTPYSPTPMTYLETTAQFYAQVAETPDVGLCCVQSAPLNFPGLRIPERMQEMNYGCGTTVHAAELANQPTVLYVGVGVDWRRCNLPIFPDERPA
ncbi:MAG: hypothetical protein EDM05_033540 [Leptolyngbya sp. IPPAS B-1204]